MGSDLSPATGAGPHLPLHHTVTATLTTTN